MSGEIRGFYNCALTVLLACSGQRSGMLLNNLQCTGQPHMTKNYLDHMSIVPSLRNLDLQRNDDGLTRVVVMEVVRIESLKIHFRVASKWYRTVDRLNMGF